MTRPTRFGLLAVGLGLAGCAGQPEYTPPPPPPTAPLTVAQWQTLPPAEKHDPDTLERLKLGEPKLRTRQGWDRFYHTTLAPARKKDLPPGP